VVGMAGRVIFIHEHAGLAAELDVFFQSGMEAGGCGGSSSVAVAAGWAVFSSSQLC